MSNLSQIKSILVEVEAQLEAQLAPVRSQLLGRFEELAPALGSLEALGRPPLTSREFPYRSPEPLVPASPDGYNLAQATAFVRAGAGDGEAWSPPALPLGSRVGAYKVLEVVHTSHRSITYRCRGKGGLEVALREFCPMLECSRDGTHLDLELKSPVTADMFALEGQTPAAIGPQPGVPRLLDFLEANGTAYLVTEWCRGRSLQRLIEERHAQALKTVRGGPSALGRLPEREALAVILKAALALQGIHSAGFLHRDLRPEHLLLTPGGNPGDAVVLLDLEMAARFDESGVERPRVRSSPGLTAPEAAVSSPQQGPCADIYALGVVLCQMLGWGIIPPVAVWMAGRDDLPPELNLLRLTYRGLGREVWDEVAKGGLSYEQGLLSGLPREVSPRTRATVSAAISPDPKERPQKVAEFLKMLPAR